MSSSWNHPSAGPSRSSGHFNRSRRPEGPEEGEIDDRPIQPRKSKSPTKWKNPLGVDDGEYGPSRPPKEPRGRGVEISGYKVTRVSSYSPEKDGALNLPAKPAVPSGPISEDIPYRPSGSSHANKQDSHRSSVNQPPSHPRSSPREYGNDRRDRNRERDRYGDNRDREGDRYGDDRRRGDHYDDRRRNDYYDDRREDRYRYSDERRHESWRDDRYRNGGNREYDRYVPGDSRDHRPRYDNVDRYHTDAPNEYRNRRKSRSRSRSTEEGEVQEVSETSARPPTPPPPTSEVADSYRPKKIKRPTRTSISGADGEENSQIPTPPVDEDGDGIATPPLEDMPPPPSMPPPPRPPSTTPPPAPPAPDDPSHHDEEPPDSTSLPPKPVHRALAATKSADLDNGLPPVPSAPNRNDVQPTTRVSTPLTKTDSGKIIRTPKTFHMWTAEEELDALKTTFAGVTTLDSYETTRKLGEGTFGVVTMAKERSTGAMVALKKLITHNPRDGVSVTTAREIKILKALDHPNVVPIKDMIVERERMLDRSERGQVFMVFPYMDHDLCGLLGNQDFRMTHSLAKLLFKQILLGMAYIHTNNLIHRDIKTANILVDKAGRVMIADFGLARARSVEGSMPAHMETEYTNMVVTRWYRAPELLLGDTRYGPAVDMWSLGCVLGEMYHRLPILAGESDRDQLYKIFSRCGPLNEDTFPRWSELPGFPDAPGFAWDKTPMETPVLDLGKSWSMERPAADLMVKLLNLDPKKRITADEALNHAWFWISPKPPVIHDGLLKVESSHEMTTRHRDPPPQAVRPPEQVPRPPHQPRPPPQNFQTHRHQPPHMGGAPYAQPGYPPPQQINPYASGPPQNYGPPNPNQQMPFNHHQQYRPTHQNFPQSNQHFPQSQNQNQHPHHFPNAPSLPSRPSGLAVPPPPFSLTGNTGNAPPAPFALRPNPTNGSSQRPPMNNGQGLYQGQGQGHNVQKRPYPNGNMDNNVPKKPKADYRSQPKADYRSQDSNHSNGNGNGGLPYE